MRIFRHITSACVQMVEACDAVLRVQKLVLVGIHNATRRRLALVNTNLDAKMRLRCASILVTLTALIVDKHTHCSSIEDTTQFGPPLDGQGSGECSVYIWSLRLILEQCCILTKMMPDTGGGCAP